MKRILTATAAIALMAASPLAFADNTQTGAATANPSAPATVAPPETGTSNPARAPNGSTSDSTKVSNDTTQQGQTAPSAVSTTGNQDKAPAKVGSADMSQDQASGQSQDQSSGGAMPKHHRVHHVAAKNGDGQERDVTAALNVLYSNGYSNPQNVQPTKGHKVDATATKGGQSVNVEIDPAAGTIAQQNS